MNGAGGTCRPTAVSGSGSEDPALTGAGGLRHGAAVVDSERALLEVAVPFLDEGRTAGDLTVLSCSPETTELLRHELGTRARGVESDPGLTLLGARPPDMFTHFRQYAHRAVQGGTGRLRVLAEVAFPAEVRYRREEMRVESAANRVMARWPVTGLCLYDSRRLPAEVVASACDTHPELVAGTTWTASPSFREPTDYVRALPRPRESVENAAPVAVIEHAPRLPDLRRQLGLVLAGHVPDGEQREDLHLALSEVAANAFRHGARPVSARVWANRSHIVCEISDSGRGFDDPLAGFVPARGYDLSRGGMGLWLARKLWDHVDLLPGPQGFTVRLSTSLR